MMNHTKKYGRETGSSTLFGIVTACSFLPMIVLSLLGGVLADRVNKRNIMVCLDFMTAGIPALVPKEKILSANGVVNQIGALAGFLGPVVGGLLTVLLEKRLRPQKAYIPLFFCAMFSIQMLSVVQAETPQHLVGKVVACVMTFIMCVQPIGQLLYGILFERFTNPSILIIGVGAISLAIAMYSKKVLAKLGGER